ncbi:MAG: superoxide dismutase [Alphaproteobacteria bacterium]|nr:superoxide dismutase [Alphaproteobacteria bacterium]
MLQIKPLPYSFDALSPIIGSETLTFHHDKHYAGYVARTNELLPPDWHKKSLLEIICLARDAKKTALFNQAAQVWNHEFFFSGLSVAPENQAIPDALKTLIDRDFGDVDHLKMEIVKAAGSLFGSGWVWLARVNDYLEIQSTSNAETPLGLDGVKPLWVLDVWEHAYYLDYQNRRTDYATEVVSKAINWQFVAQNLDV